jgi:hypothetical protein
MLGDRIDAVHSQRHAQTYLRCANAARHDRNPAVEQSNGRADAIAAEHTKGRRRREAIGMAIGYCGPPGFWLGMSVIGRLGIGLGDGVFGSVGIFAAGMSVMSLTGVPLSRPP